MKKSTQFSFDDLLRDVIDKGLCNKCGVCVSFCTANQIGAIEMCGCEENVPQYVDSDKCFRCGICYLICPQTHELNEEVKDEFGWSSPMGIFQDIFSAQATDGEIREVATDGGVVTALLLYMLENKIVDGAIVAKRTGLFTREPDIVTTRDGLIQAAGSQFSELPHLEEMGKKYSTYVSVIPVVRMFGPKLSTKLAVVGTPCQIKAIRKMQVLNILPSDVVFFTIGLFCMQCFTFDNFLEKTFIKRDQINPEDILKINVKEDFRLIMKSGRTIHIPFEEIEDIAKPACLACQEFANDFADISMGGIGSPDGYTTTMIRTTLGKRIFTDAVRRGYIKPVIASKADKAKMLSLIKTFVERKWERAEKYKMDNLCAECERLNRHLNWVVSFVSHELNSTLGTIIMNISALADDEIAGRLDKDKYKKMMLGALNSLKLMQDMILNYLMSSRIKKGILGFAPTRVSLRAEVIRQIIKRLEPMFKMKGMSLVFDKCDEIKMTFDKSLIRITINNLINNAIKYGTANTSIHATLKNWDNGFEFSITNEGIGIPEDKLEAVFGEFARFDKLGIGGTGLGLHLVEIIAALHNGSIKADAGYILEDKLITYEMLRNNPDFYDINVEDKKLRKFATFILRIPDSIPAESGLEVKNRN